MRWLVVLLAACADEAAIAPNTCGNWVLEGTEDCDQPTGCTADCRFACDVDACPDGMTCGLDRACHAPTGRFASGELSAPLGLTDFRAGDLDGDHRADVLGIAGTSVRAAYAANDFALPLDAPLPPPNGRVVIGDYDGDGRADVVVPVFDGLAAISTVRGAPVEVAWPSAPDAHAIAVGAALALNQLTSLRDDAGAVSLVDPSGVRKPCGLDLQTSQISLPNLVSWFDKDHPIVPFVYNYPGAAPRLCVDGLKPASPVLATLDFTSPPPIGVAFFAGTTASCPDLFAPLWAGVPGLVHYQATGTPGSCGLDESETSFIGAPLSSLDGTSVITTGGVLAPSGSLDCPLKGYCQTLTADHPWTHATAGDFDGTAPKDFAVTGEQPGLEVYLAAGASGFHRHLIATTGVPIDVVAFDFDGDDRADLAVALPDPIDPTKSLIQVSFDRETLSAPLRLPRVTSLSFVATGHDIELVAATADGAIWTIYTRDRVLYTPARFATTRITGQLAATSGTNAVIGGFATDNRPGLLGIFGPQVSGASALAYAQLAVTPTGFSTISEAGAGGCGFGGFCASTATWVAMPVPQGALALAFSSADDLQPDECGESYLARGNSEPFPQAMGCVMLQGPASRNRVERARDLGDGLLETTGDGEVWTARVAFGGDQVPVFDNWMSMALVVGNGASCSDVARLELGMRDDYGAGLDLAAACTVGGTTSVYGIFTAPVSNDDPTPRVEKLFDVPTGGPLRLESGDVDGDGLADLLYSDGVSLRVRLQCDPHGGCL